jgi:hypothetical protein
MHTDCIKSVQNYRRKVEVNRPLGLEEKVCENKKDVRQDK